MKPSFKCEGKAYFRHRNAQRACPSQGFTIRNVQGNYWKQEGPANDSRWDLCLWKGQRDGRSGKYTAGNYCAGKIWLSMEPQHVCWICLVQPLLHAITFSSCSIVCLCGSRLLWDLAEYLVFFTCSCCIERCKCGSQWDAFASSLFALLLLCLLCWTLVPLLVMQTSFILAVLQTTGVFSFAFKYGDISLGFSSFLIILFVCLLNIMFASSNGSS